MKTKYVIKGFINNQYVYFIKIEKGLFFGQENWDIRHYSRTLKGATIYDTIEDAEEACSNLGNDKFKIYPICPSCEREYSGYPAISRIDNKTKICSRCGTNEAITIFMQN